MTDKEAKDLFEKVHFLHEQNDMENDINNIYSVLSQSPINIFQVKKQIKTVNEKHPENVVIFNMIFPPQGNRVSVDSAPDDYLISDLTWKLNYLQAKKDGKAYEEFCKTMRGIIQENQNGVQR